VTADGDAAMNARKTSRWLRVDPRDLNGARRPSDHRPVLS